MRKESYDKPLLVVPNQKTRMLSNGELPIDPESQRAFPPGNANRA